MCGPAERRETTVTTSRRLVVPLVNANFVTLVLATEAEKAAG